MIFLLRTLHSQITNYNVQYGNVTTYNRCHRIVLSHKLCNVTLQFRRLQIQNKSTVTYQKDLYFIPCYQQMQIIDFVKE